MHELAPGRFRAPLLHFFWLMCCDEEVAPAQPAQDTRAGALQVVIQKPASGPLGMRFVDQGLDGVIRKIVFAEVGPYGSAAGICLNDQLVGINERGFSEQTNVDRVVNLIASLPPGPITLFIRAGPNRAQQIASAQAIAPVSAIPAVSPPMAQPVASGVELVPTSPAPPVAHAVMMQPVAQAGMQPMPVAVAQPMTQQPMPVAVATPVVA